MRLIPSKYWTSQSNLASWHGGLVRTSSDLRILAQLGGEPILGLLHQQEEDSKNDRRATKD